MLSSRTVYVLQPLHLPKRPSEFATEPDLLFTSHAGTFRDISHGLPELCHHRAMAWEAIVLQPFEGEKRLFKIGLMTFKARSAQTDYQFAFIETQLPPGANVQPHHHPEAEMFYIVDGQFDFWIGDTSRPVSCAVGAFICVPPHVKHAFANTGKSAGRIFGMLAPGSDDGLESFFRSMSIPINNPEEVPDLNQPVEHVQEIIAERRTSFSAT